MPNYRLLEDLDLPPRRWQEQFLYPYAQIPTTNRLLQTDFVD
jgi:hypothetical protein